jgi:tRNA(Ser,Leu) C12 N-acetylase TAN1
MMKFTHYTKKGFCALNEFWHEKQWSSRTQGIVATERQIAADSPLSPSDSQAPERFVRDWNVVVTVHEAGFSKGYKFLETMGSVAKTDFFNVLVMRVEDIRQALEFLQDKLAGDPTVADLIARFVPVTHAFSFQSPEIFEARAREIVSQWVTALEGKSFHVRMRRRGFKGRLSSMDEERFLDEYLLDALEKTGTPGRIEFTDPDCIIAVVTIGTQAGLSFWNREDLRRYALLKPD